MQSQMQNLMLASVSDQYIYKVINPPYAPEKNLLWFIIDSSGIGFSVDQVYLRPFYYRMQVMHS